MKILYAALFICFIFPFDTRGQEQKGLIPDFATVQYAGSIGYFSAGVGYNIFKSKARFSTHFGMVPPNKGGHLNILSAKLFFKPATFTIWNRVRMNPFDIGIMASYHYGDNFQTRWPENIPRNYYWWHPALRAHLAMESSVTYEFRKDQRLTSITGYIEFNTNELYFLSFVQNVKTISFWDIVKIGTGVRMNF